MGDSEQKILDGVREILSRVLKIKPDEIMLQSKLQDELGIDSVDFWDIVASLEKKFKYRITDKEATSLETVSDLINTLSRQVKK
jgi:acyl carrier protein